ncbi:MAG: hypothetical protein KatS3mg009_3294 [Acidimicrobiia bacterium]|nr:MAG: hypothetical protein KatS3mg009_3294 [Acidimicrobiia bacterium]
MEERSPDLPGRTDPPGRTPDRRRDAVARRGAGTARSVQLRLLPGHAGAPRPEWVLDERTRAIGRQGVAQLRETLRRARPPRPTEQRYGKAS